MGGKTRDPSSKPPNQGHKDVKGQVEKCTHQGVKYNLINVDQEGQTTQVTESTKRMLDI